MVKTLLIILAIMCIFAFPSYAGNNIKIYCGRDRATVSLNKIQNVFLRINEIGDNANSASSYSIEITLPATFKKGVIFRHYMYIDCGSRAHAEKEIKRINHMWRNFVGPSRWDIWMKEMK